MTQIHYPEGFDWSCHNKGSCCHNEWEIPVEKQDAERIQALPLERIDPRFEAWPMFEESSINPGHTVLRRTSNRCGFLSGSDKCGLHEQFGRDAKPQQCQDFPLMLVRAPGGVYAGLSLECPSVIANQGQPIQEQEPRIQRRLTHPESIAELPESILLAEDLPISWEDYLRIENSLGQLLRIETVPIEERLIGGGVFLGMLEQFLRQAHLESDYSATEVIEKYAASMEEIGFSRVFKIARIKPRSPKRQAMFQRMLVGMLLTFRHSLGEEISPTRAGMRILWSYLRHAMGRGKIEITPALRQFRHKEFHHSLFDPNESYAAYQLERYAAQLIFRKDLLKGGELVKGYNLLLLHYSLIRWTASALAAAAGEREASRHNLDKAISTVEKYYSADRVFERMFKQYPVLSGIFFSATRRKNYPYMIVRSPV